MLLSSERAVLQNCAVRPGWRTARAVCVVDWKRSAHGCFTCQTFVVSWYICSERVLALSLVMRSRVHTGALHKSVPNTEHLPGLLCSVHSLVCSSCDSRHQQSHRVCSGIRGWLCRHSSPLQQLALEHSDVYGSCILRHLDILDLQALCASCRTLCGTTQKEATTGETQVCHES